MFDVSVATVADLEDEVALTAVTWKESSVRVLIGADISNIAKEMDEYHHR